MANTIITKNSSTASAVPTAGDLVQGELAVNVTDKRLFTEDAGGNIVEIGTNPSTINIDAGTIDGTAIGGTTPTTGAFTTLTANTSLTAATADINGGTIDGTTIGGTTAAAGAFTTLSASGNVTLSGGTANGVAYLNGSKVLTSGSALTFNGTNLATTGDVLLNNAQYYYSKSSAGSNVRLLGINSGDVLYLGVDSGPTSMIVNASSTSTNISFSASGSEQMRLTSTGLGIGTSSPSQRLDVWSGTASSAVAQFTGTNGGRGLKISTALVNSVNDAGVILDAQQASGVLMLATGGTERLRIDSSGNLGLGVTPSAWGAMLALQLGDYGSGLATWKTNRNTYITSNAYFGSDFRYATTGAASYYNVSGEDGAHKWHTAPSGTAGNAISFTQAMTLDASGRLGIGTSSPAYKLAVSNGTQTGLINPRASASGGLAVGTDIASAGHVLNLAGDLAGGGTGGGVNVAYYSSASSTWNAAISIRNTASTYSNLLLMPDGGNVGIGTSSPGDKIELGGNGSGIIIRSPNGTRYRLTVTDLGVLSIAAA